MNVLLIWEDVPDETRIYLLKDISPDEWEMLNFCNGKYLGQEINKKEERALERLLIMTTDRNDKRAKWIDNQIKLPYCNTCTIDLILQCGIIM